jgi:predicted DNA-binding WGR domain protein
LRYAEAASIGDVEIASQLLATLSQARTATDARERADDAVVGQLASALEERGYHVDRSVGQSHFRCDLAVSRAGDRAYRLGILVDTADWYAQRDLIERELLKPDLLTAFGWRTYVVLARDWYQDRAGVLERIERLLAGEELEEPVDEGNLLPTDPPADTPPEVGLDKTSVRPAPPANVAQSESPSETGDSGSPTPPPVASAPSEPSAEESADHWTEYLEFVGGGSSKFWEISVKGSEQTVRFGRIGSRGQSVTKAFADRDAALADAQRQAEGKRRKGYGPKGPET